MPQSSSTQKASPSTKNNGKKSAHDLVVLTHTSGRIHAHSQPGHMGVWREGGRGGGAGRCLSGGGRGSRGEGSPALPK